MHQFKTVTHFNRDILYSLWNTTNTETTLAGFSIKQVISFIQIGWEHKENLSSCRCPLQVSCHKTYSNSNGPLTPNQSTLHPLPSMYFTAFHCIYLYRSTHKTHNPFSLLNKNRKKQFFIFHEQDTSLRSQD